MAAPAFAPDRIAGLVVEVEDLSTTRAFYEPLLEGRGSWTSQASRLAFTSGKERIVFVRKSKPRTLSEFGRHQALRIDSAQLPSLVVRLQAGGHEVSQWREDHPSERETTAYVRDPSGNQLQLVPSDADGALLDHSTLVLHDLELGECFYGDALGGQVTYYHGWRTSDRIEAAAWAEGRDPCAPWTRRNDVSYRLRRPIPLPNPQLFLEYGSSQLGLILAARHVQEPPEEQVRGTPRVVFSTTRSADEVEDHLCRTRLAAVSLRHEGHPVRFERARDVFFLRDPGGNFVELQCGSAS